MRVLRDGYFVGVGANHLAVDMLNSQIAVLVVYLSPRLGLSNSDIGLVVLIYLACGSLTQPIFGWLLDKYRIEWIVGAALLWLAAWVSVAVTVSGIWAVVALATGALGSAAFHASGIERAAMRGGIIMGGRAATAASIFMFFGMTGTTLGPMIGGKLLEEIGLRGILLLTGLTIPVAINSLVQVSRGKLERRGEEESFKVGQGKNDRNDMSQVGWVVVAIALVAILVAGPGATSMTFLPKLLQDRNFSPSAYGMATSVFMGGAALGGLLGGILADRFGKIKIVFWTMLMAVAPMYYYPVVRGGGMYALVLLAGIFTGAAFPVIVVLAQSLFPRWRALASSLTLGLMWASAALCAYVFGVAADSYSLEGVLRVNAAMCLVCALVSLILMYGSRGKLLALERLG